ncbi:hypothetical protein niasHT_018850 [Heterodera trifolii]|uniref:FLYWCH-type domain-containing protein n=1 Tax=Heterodera trifolii TaxID=157864 RepID=A0ABD2KYA6_9BILA
MNRKKVEVLQKCRKRKFLDNSDSEDETISDHREENDENFEEERSIINFELGKTQKGGICLWRGGFRFTQKQKNLWRCAVRSCLASVTIVREDNDSMAGFLGETDHNHLPEPQKQQAETRRQKILECVQVEPRTKPRQLLAEVRRSTADETYVAMGSDNALNCLMRRQKRKILGNVDCADPLAFVIPEKLRSKNGEDIVLYDSRTVGIGEKDVVLVFGSERTLDILSKNSATWHLDGTFKASPNMWEQCFVVGASPVLGKNPSFVGHCFQFHIGTSIDRQVDAARSARNFIHKRHKRYVLQDAVIMRILADATYNSDAEIQELMTALGLQVAGYAGKLMDYENMEDSVQAP